MGSLGDIGAINSSGILTQILKYQTPKWINIMMLIFTAIILFLTIYIAFFK